MSSQREPNSQSGYCRAPHIGGCVDQTDIDLLKTSLNREVQFHCKDGEVIVGPLHFVSDEERDVIYDLVSSNRMSRYQSFGNSAYRLTFDEIGFVTLPES